MPPSLATNVEVEIKKIFIYKKILHIIHYYHIHQEGLA